MKLTKVVINRPKISLSFVFEKEGRSLVVNVYNRDAFNFFYKKTADKVYKGKLLEAFKIDEIHGERIYQPMFDLAKERLNETI